MNPIDINENENENENEPYELTKIKVVKVVNTINEPVDEKLTEQNEFKSQNQDLFKDVMTTESTNTHVSMKTTIRQKILNEYIYPSCESDIRTALSAQKWWSYAGGCFITLKYICLSLAPVITFSAPTFVKYRDELNYSSGVIGIVALGFDRLSVYCFMNSKKKTEKLNNLLNSLNINYQKPNDSFEEPITDKK